ncbi:MAG TPA: pilus assembly protein PilM [Phycisphaerae bacterium]|nr:pilus assembly protein PilM [Phycisphaerae bacterium]
MIVGDRNILCIDWDERSLRALEARDRRGGLRVYKAVQVPLPEGMNSRDPVEMGEFLRQSLAEHRIRTRRAIVDVPRQDAVFTLMSLPRSTPEELAAMVHVQAAKELPFAKDQAVVDFAVCGEQKEGMCDVWMAGVRTAVVDRYQQVVTGAGLKLERIGLRPYANVAALNAAGPSEGRTLMVDIGPSLTEINVVVDGRLVYSRAASVSVPPGGLHVQPVQAVPGEAAGSEGTIPLLDESVPRPGPMESLLIEVSRTVEAYRAAAPGSVINRVVLAGTVPLDAQVIDRIERRLGAPTVVFEAPASVAWRRSKEVSGAPFSAVFGLALSSAGEELSHFDFLHPKEPEAAQRVRQRQRPILVVTIAMFVTAASVLAYQPIRSRKAQIETLKKKISFANSDAKARKELLAQLADVQAWQARNFIWIDRLKELSEVFPPTNEAYISRLDCNEKGTINMELFTRDELVATKIVDRVANDLKDADKKPLYRAHPGRMESSKLNDYPNKDRVIIEMELPAEGGGKGGKTGESLKG